MIYDLYQAQDDFFAPFRRGANAWLDVWGDHASVRHLAPNRLAAATAELFATAVVTHARPPYGITSTVIGDRTVPVREVPVLTTPFGTLLRFEKEEAPPQPKVLLIAPMSGHFATLLRPTVHTMLPDCDVYITDWHNARDVPLAAGHFGIDEYVDVLIRFLETLGPANHMVAVCQPAVTAMVAVAVMSAARNPATPRSMTLMAGPIDTRINPTRVNRLSEHQSLEEFERRSIGTVPLRYKGAGRRVYPGFVQLTSFMAMNADRHINAHLAQLRRLFSGDTEGAAAHRRFYDEYFAVCDLPADFYLETVQRVFQRHDLPRRAWRHHGELVDPGAIRRTNLLVVEGERDDICGVGQTMAALELCDRMPPSRKTYHLQTGAGHYGVFSGRSWVNQVYPKLRGMIGTS